MSNELICVEKGHDWYIHDGAFWDKAECLTCGKTIRDLKLYYSDLPNRRKKDVEQGGTDNE
jgi:hypothetical protein